MTIDVEINPKSIHYDIQSDTGYDSIIYTFSTNPNKM